MATNAVGAIDQQLSPGEIVVPSDLVDMTKSRVGTFYESSPVTHIDVSQPYCPKVREILTSSTIATGRSPPKDVVMACTGDHATRPPQRSRCSGQWDAE